MTGDCIAHPSQTVDHFDHVDVDRAVDDAAAATNAARPAMLHHEAPLLVVVVELDPAGLAVPEILAPGHGRVLRVQAGVRGPHARAVGAAELDLVLHVVAVAGRAGGAAVPASQALLPQLLPDLAAV